MVPASSLSCWVEREERAVNSERKSLLSGPAPSHIPHREGVSEGASGMREAVLLPEVL